jgi:hypothetical protein
VRQQSAVPLETIFDTSQPQRVPDHRLIADDNWFSGLSFDFTYDIE